MCTLKQAIQHVCGSCPTSEVRRAFLLTDSLKEAKKSKFDSNSLLKVCYLTITNAHTVVEFIINLSSDVHVGFIRR